jgi:hypothetical protein
MDADLQQSLDLHAEAHAGIGLRAVSAVDREVEIRGKIPALRFLRL